MDNNDAITEIRADVEKLKSVVADKDAKIQSLTDENAKLTEQSAEMTTQIADLKTKSESSDAVSPDLAAAIGELHDLAQGNQPAATT